MNGQKQYKVGECLTLKEAKELMDDVDFNTEQLSYTEGIKQTDKGMVQLIDHIWLYETICRIDGNHPWQYMGRCYQDEMRNRDPSIAERVFIVSQFASNEAGSVQQNFQFAAVLAKKTYVLGKMPIVPHLYFPTFMCDNNVTEREWSIAAGHALMRKCTSVEVWMIDHWLSEGMEADIDFAIEELGINPIYHSVPKEARDRVINGEPWDIVMSWEGKDYYVTNEA